MDTCPAYTALSYTWGSPKLDEMGRFTCQSGPDVLLDIDGYSVAIGNNLGQALTSIRHEDTPRILWVDALCIDQGNTAERSQQVNLMTKIYQRSDQVIFWLGPADEASKVAFDAAHELCWSAKAIIWETAAEQLGKSMRELSENAILEALREGLGWLPVLHTKLMTTEALDGFATALRQSPFSCSDDTNISELAKSLYGPSSLAYALTTNEVLLSYKPIAAILQAWDDTFIHRAYFKRLWIYQEFLQASAGVIKCGVHELSLDQMFLLSYALPTSSADEDSGLFIRTCDSASIRKITSSLAGLLALMIDKSQVPMSFARAKEMNQIRTCLEPRDQIYALLGVSRPMPIAVDYSKSIPTVFIEAARAIIEQEGNLNILCMAEANDLRDGQSFNRQSLPSWVPHFESFVTSRRLNSFRETFNEQMCRAGGPLVHGPALVSTHPVEHLTISGTCVSEIISAGSRMMTYRTKLLPDDLWKIYMDLEDRHTPHNCSGEQKTLFWRTLVMDQYPNNVGFNQRIERNEQSRCNFFGDLHTALTTNEPPQRLSHALKVHYNDKAFCVLNDGRYALVFGDVRAGDAVFIARGATNPFIVRRWSGDFGWEAAKMAWSIGMGAMDSLWKFVGGAYVHGLMDGELWSTDASTCAKEIEITLA